MVSRVRSSAPGVDEYGDPLAGTVTVEPIEGGYVAPRMSDPVEGKGREGVIVGLTLFAPHGTDLVRTDLIEVNARRWRIEGEIAEWVHPWTEWAPGVTAALVAAEG